MAPFWATLVKIGLLLNLASGHTGYKLEKLKILTPLQKLSKNVGDLGKLIVDTVFEKLPKFQ